MQFLALYSQISEGMHILFHDELSDQLDVSFAVATQIIFFPLM